MYWCKYDYLEILEMRVPICKIMQKPDSHITIF